MQTQRPKDEAVATVYLTPKDCLWGMFPIIVFPSLLLVTSLIQKSPYTAAIFLLFGGFRGGELLGWLWLLVKVRRGHKIVAPRSLPPEQRSHCEASLLIAVFDFVVYSLAFLGLCLYALCRDHSMPVLLGIAFLGTFLLVWSLKYWRDFRSWHTVNRFRNRDSERE